MKEKTDLLAQELFDSMQETLGTNMADMLTATEIESLKATLSQDAQNSINESPDAISYKNKLNEIEKIKNYLASNSSSKFTPELVDHYIKFCNNNGFPVNPEFWKERLEKSDAENEYYRVALVDSWNQAVESVAQDLELQIGKPVSAADNQAGATPEESSQESSQENSQENSQEDSQVDSQENTQANPQVDSQIDLEQTAKNFAPLAQMFNLDHQQVLEILKEAELQSNNSNSKQNNLTLDPATKEVLKNLFNGKDLTREDIQDIFAGKPQSANSLNSQENSEGNPEISSSSSASPVGMGAGSGNSALQSLANLTPEQAKQLLKQLHALQQKQSQAQTSASQPTSTEQPTATEQPTSTEQPASSATSSQVAEGAEAGETKTEVQGDAQEQSSPEGSEGSASDASALNTAGDSAGTDAQAPTAMNTQANLEQLLKQMQAQLPQLKQAGADVSKIEQVSQEQQVQQAADQHSTQMIRSGLQSILDSLQSHTDKQLNDMLNAFKEQTLKRIQNILGPMGKVAEQLNAPLTSLFSDQELKSMVEAAVKQTSTPNYTPNYNPNSNPYNTPNQSEDDFTGMGGGIGVGAGSGSLQSQDWSQILHWSSKIQNNENLQKILKLLGRMSSDRQQKEKSVAVEHSEEKKVVDPFVQEEINQLNFSNDLANVLPNELALSMDPDTEVLFRLKYVERQLASYHKEGVTSRKNQSKHQEKRKSNSEQQGPIILCVDTSASMLGMPEEVAKACAYYLAGMAIKEKRSLFIINFSTSVVSLEVNEDTGITKVAKFLADSFHGGTDIMPALDLAEKVIKKDNFKKADVLVISDMGYYLPDGYFDSMKKRIGEDTKFYGLDITLFNNFSFFDNYDISHGLDRHWTVSNSSLFGDEPKITIKEKLKNAKEYTVVNDEDLSSDQGVNAKSKAKSKSGDKAKDKAKTKSYSSAMASMYTGKTKKPKSKSLFAKLKKKQSKANKTSATNA